MGKDLTAYRRVRSATSLTYAVRRQLMISTLQLGQEPTDSTQVRLLKSGFLRSPRSAVRADP